MEFYALTYSTDGINVRVSDERDAAMTDYPKELRRMAADIRADLRPLHRDAVNGLTKQINTFSRPKKTRP